MYFTIYLVNYINIAHKSTLLRHLSQKSGKKPDL